MSAALRCWRLGGGGGRIRGICLNSRRRNYFARAVSDQDVDAYERDGAVCLRGVVPLEWIERIKNGVAKNEASPGIGFESLPTPSDNGGEDSEVGGAFWNDYCNWPRISEFKSFVLESGISDVAACLLRKQEVCFYHEHVLVKEPRAGKASFHVVRKECVLGWQRPGTMTNPIIPSMGRSSRCGFRWTPSPKEAAFASSKLRIAGGACLSRGNSRRSRAIKGNTSDKRRRVVSWRFLSPDAVMVRRPWEISPPVTGGLEEGQAIGDYCQARGASTATTLHSSTTSALSSQPSLLRGDTHEAAAAAYDFILIERQK
eukprot:jgi/Bigna1/144003/aug1.83_g18711